MSTAARYWLFVEAGWAALAAGSDQIAGQYSAAAVRTLPPAAWRGRRR